MTPPKSLLPRWSYSFTEHDLDYLRQRGWLSRAEEEMLRTIDGRLNHILPSKLARAEPLVVPKDHPFYDEFRHRMEAEAHRQMRLLELDRQERRLLDYHGRSFEGHPWEL